MPDPRPADAPGRRPARPLSLEPGYRVRELTAVSASLPGLGPVPRAVAH
ncbi:hypothetical protein [Kitasatospora sp. CB02891]|nr:hypothetical protein [Kitasatospora sp. CB02891]